VTKVIQLVFLVSGKTSSKDLTRNAVSAGKEANSMDWIRTFVTKMMLYKIRRCHQEVVKIPALIE